MRMLRLAPNSLVNCRANSEFKALSRNVLYGCFIRELSRQRPLSARAKRACMMLLQNSAYLHQPRIHSRRFGNYLSPYLE